MFSQASVILFTGGVWQTPPGQTPPWADNPWADTPWADTPWADTPWADTPQADTPQADTPKQDTPSRWLLQRTVRNLLECILVLIGVWKKSFENNIPSSFPRRM